MGCIAVVQTLRGCFFYGDGMTQVKTEADFKKIHKEISENQNWVKGKLVQNCKAKNSNMGSKQRGKE